MRHELQTERFYLARFYSEALEANGCAPLHIPLIPDPEYVESIVERLDGILRSIGVPPEQIHFERFALI